MTTSEINPQRSEKYRAVDKLNYVPKLIILVAICCIVSVVSYFRAEQARDDAKEALAQTATWQVMYKETERECRLAQLEIDDFKTTLIRAGLDVPHEGESP